MLLQKLFKPALPNDAVVSFYIQAQKLVLAVYHLCTNQLNKVDIAARYQVRTVPCLLQSCMNRACSISRPEVLKNNQA